MPREAELVSLPYSPWTEKCRWVLEHHGVPYRKTPHTPIFGELTLRLRRKRWSGRASVPMLIDEDGAHEGSTTIARHADERGSGAKLFPSAQLDAITRWDAQSDRGMVLGRVLATERLLEDKEALMAVTPRGLPFRASLGKLGSQYIARKYRKLTAGTDPRAELTAILEDLRRGLGGRPYLLGEFTFADITMATLLHFVRPPDEQHVRLDPTVRRVWTDPVLVPLFGDLLVWRDGLYERHRR